MKHPRETHRPRMTPEQRADHERDILAKLSQGHSRDAAERLIQGYGPELYGYLVGILPTEDDAEEVFAHFAALLLEHLAAFRGESSVRTWSYAVVRNAARTILRARAREARRAEPISNAEARGALEQLARSSTTEWRKSSVKDAFRDLRRKLSEEDQTILILRIDRELPWRDVALVTGDFEGKPSPDDLRREANRIKKRFEGAIEKLRDLGIAAGLLPAEEP